MSENLVLRWWRPCGRNRCIPCSFALQYSSPLAPRCKLPRAQRVC